MIAEARGKRHQARAQVDKLARQMTRLDRKVANVDWQIQTMIEDDEREDRGESGWSGPKFKFVVQDYA